MWFLTKGGNGFEFIYRLISNGIYWREGTR